MTRYFNDKHPGIHSGKDIVVAGNELTADPETEYSCKYCRRIMHKTKIIDSSHQNPSINLYCSFCGIESEIEEDTRKKSRLKVPSGPVTNPSVSYAPEIGMPRKKNEPRGSFRRLQERGIKITDYKERGWRKQNDE
jgi:hypothetical protein